MLFSIFLCLLGKSKLEKMKRTTLILILSLFSTLTYGQVTKSIVITGSVKNNESPFVSVEDTLLQLSPGGGFFFKRNISHSRYYDIKYKEKKFKVFIEPGDTVEIIMNAVNPDERIHFRGYFPPINRYLHQKSLIDKQLTDYFNSNTLKWHSLFKKNETNFLKELDSLRNLYLQPLEKLESKHKEEVNQKFLFTTRKDIKFTFDWFIFYYPYFHSRFTGEKVNLTKETRAYLNDINLDHPWLLEIDNYNQFGEEVLRPKIRKEFNNNKSLKNSDNRWLKASLNIVSEYFNNRETIDYWRYLFIKNHIEDNGVKNIESFIENFREKSENEELKKDLIKIYNIELRKRKGHPIMTYKTVDGFQLDAHIFMPDSLKKGDKKPVSVYFHGGSWSEGKPAWHFGQSKFGFVKVCIEYRTYDRYGVLPFEAISDAKSAIRWVRQNANELNADTSKVIAFGNSAGGHLALAAAMLDTLDEPGENQKISSRPNALVLNAAVYNLKNVWFDYLVEDKNKITAISPLQNVKKDLPPMLIFHGEADMQSSPFKFCKQFVEKMDSAGNEVYFYPLEGMGHFLWRNGHYWQISEKAKRDFFREMGFLKKINPGL